MRRRREPRGSFSGDGQRVPDRSPLHSKRDFEMDSTLIACRLTKQEPSRPDRHEGDPKQDRDRQVPPELGRLV